MNTTAAFAGFAYKVKALFRVNKKPAARVYEHTTKFASQNSKNARKYEKKHSPKRSPRASRTRKEHARPVYEKHLMALFWTNVKDFIVKFVSGADSEQEEFTKAPNFSSDSTATSPTAARKGALNTTTSPTATKKLQRKPNGYDVEATGAEDELDSKEDTKLLKEGEDTDDEVLSEEGKGTTSSLQAGWNISNLIQGKTEIHSAI